MLDIGITKIFVVAIIALIVIGPERLPRMARMLGTLLGRAKGYLDEVKTEVNRSIELDELRKIRDETKSAMETVKKEINSGIEKFSETMNESVTDGASDTENDNESVVDRPRFTRRKKHLVYVNPDKKWRSKVSVTPKWYKSLHRTRTRIQSDAAKHQYKKPY